MADAKRSSSSTRGKKKKVKTTKAVVKEVVSENVDLESNEIEDSEARLDLKHEEQLNSSPSQEKPVEG
jgi:hypothetical protein